MLIQLSQLLVVSRLLIKQPVAFVLLKHRFTEASSRRQGKVMGTYYPSLSHLHSMQKRTEYMERGNFVHQM